MKKPIYRHIGYWEGKEDCPYLMTLDADEIVANIGRHGQFHECNGESESDIEDLNDEHDASLFQMTKDRQYLVRKEEPVVDEKTGEKLYSGCYIDVYRFYLVDEDGEIIPALGVCPVCGKTVILEPELKLQSCGYCGAAVIPCSYCPFSPGSDKCKNCPLKAIRNIANKSYGFEHTLHTFVVFWNSSSEQIQQQGCQISFSTPMTGYCTWKIQGYNKGNVVILSKSGETGATYTIFEPLTEDNLLKILREITGSDYITPMHSLFVKQ